MHISSRLHLRRVLFSLEHLPPVYYTSPPNTSGCPSSKSQHCASQESLDPCRLHLQQRPAVWSI